MTFLQFYQAKYYCEVNQPALPLYAANCSLKRTIYRPQKLLHSFPPYSLPFFIQLASPLRSCRASASNRSSICFITASNPASALPDPPSSNLSFHFFPIIHQLSSLSSKPPLAATLPQTMLSVSFSPLA